ncbi:MAG TPA: Rrf2 family transcriptional regulator [Chloroflexota bacterium]|nr:Rrf2 family transcriptional regulator [Chloroflexota bacterium]
MALSKKGDYVVRAAIALARDWDSGHYRKIREVAEEMALPLSYTPQVLSALARAGLAYARAGREGGYRLSRSPAEITLLDIVQAAEGSLTPANCALRGGPCRWEDVCALHPAWSAASRALRDSLQGETLAQIASVDEALEAGTFPTPADTHRRRAASAIAP